MEQSVYYSMKINGVLIAIMLLAADAVPGLILTSEPPSLEPYCPGPVLFTCNATEITIVFRWELNNATIAQYAFDRTAQYPLDLNDTSPLIDSIQVISATLDGNSVDIASTLRVSDVSVLNGSSIHCEDSFGRESRTTLISVVSLAPPPVPAPNCSLLPLSGGPEVILQWSDMFNRDHAVDKYRVSMSPSLPSCPNTLRPDQDYSCSGLEIGQQYNISFAAFNCQQGETTTYSFQLEAPHFPIGLSLVNTDSLQWMEVTSPSISVNCTFNSTVSYLVIVQDNSGEMVTNKTVLSESCVNGVCSTTIPSSDRKCRVTVRASNMFGESDNAEFAIIVSVKYTSTNTVLMVIGLIVWFLTPGICVFTLFLMIKGFKNSSNKPLLYFSVCLLCIGALLWVVSFCLWVATGVHVEQQEDTCDPSWQSDRNGLIFAALVMSFIALFMISISLLIECILKKSERRESFCLKNSVSQDVRQLAPPNLETNEEVNKHVTAGAHTEPTENGPSQDSASPCDNAAKEEVQAKPNIVDEFRGIGVEYEPAAEQARVTVETESAMQSYSCPCHSILRFNQYFQQNKVQKPEYVAAWFHEYRRWPMESLSSARKLQVYFMNYFPEEWKYKGDKVTSDIMMDILDSSWTNCFSITRFHWWSDIRVDFQDSNWSAIGQYANMMKRSEATMSLNFAGLSDDMIKAVIIHQFGHALGLGHALMDPKDWAILKKHVDLEKMMESCGVLTADDLEVVWTGKGLSNVELSGTPLKNDCSVLRDPKSVMQYSTSLSWLTNEAHRDLKKVLSVYSGELKKVLEKYHKHINFHKVFPSADDKKTLHAILEEHTQAEKIQSGTLSKELTLEHLLNMKMKSQGETWSLIVVLAPYWQNIAQKLGIPGDAIKAIKDTKDYTDNRMMLDIWKMWFYNFDRLTNKEKYPHTFVGLNELLKDSGNEQYIIPVFEYMQDYS